MCVQYKYVYENKWLYISICILLYMMIRTVLPYINRDNAIDPLSFIVNPMAFSGIAPFAALFSIVPSAGLFCTDFNTGFIKNIFMRTQRSTYRLFLIARVIITGMTVFFAAYGILFLIALCVAPNEPMTVLPAFYEGGNWEPIFTAYGLLGVFMGKLLLAGIFGAVWAMVCLLAESLCLNKFASVVIAFVSYQTSWSVFNASMFNPAALLRADSPFIPSVGIALLIQIGLLGILCMGVTLILKWRCTNV